MQQGFSLVLSQVNNKNEGKCKGVKEWAEKELNKAAVDMQLQMRYWEEDQKRRAALKEREMAANAQKEIQDEL